MNQKIHKVITIIDNIVVEGKIKIPPGNLPINAHTFWFLFRVIIADKIHLGGIAFGISKTPASGLVVDRIRSDHFHHSYKKTTLSKD